MSLFGLFATLFTCGNILCDSVKEGTFNAESKQKAIKNGRNTWIDGHGNEYFLKTGEKVFRDNKFNIKSVKTGKILVDIEKERKANIINEWIEKTKKDGKKGAPLAYPEFNYRRYYTELSTMKRYYLIAFYDHHKECYVFHKHYYGDGEIHTNILHDEKHEITKEEYNALSGDFPDLFERGIYKPPLDCGIH